MRKTVIRRMIAAEQKKLDLFTDAVADGAIYSAIKWEGVSAIVAAEKLRALHRLTELDVDAAQTWMAVESETLQLEMSRFDPTSTSTSASSTLAASAMYVAARDLLAMYKYLLSMTDDQPAS